MTSVGAAFPSDCWFSEVVARAVSDQPTMERLGIADLRLGIEVTDGSGSPRLFGMVFDGYEVHSLGDVSASGFAPDVVISGPLEVWQEMVSAIEDHGGADGPHTLNSLTLAGVPLEARAPDAVGHDKLFRYMGTIQAVFDAAGAPAAATVP